VKSGEETRDAPLTIPEPDLELYVAGERASTAGSTAMRTTCSGSSTVTYCSEWILR